MKKCSICNQLYEDDNVFCINDGATLLFAGQTGANPPVFPTADNQTTQVVSRPQISAQIPAQSAPKDNSKWLFLIIGVLAAALVGMGIYMFAPRGEKDEKKETANQNAKTENGAESANRIETTVALTSPKTSPSVQTTINPNLNPAGNWAGDLTYPSGAAFSGQLELTDEGGGKIRGQIYWTMTSVGNRANTDKLGKSATEFVQGTYDAATRTLSLSGYSENDPYDMIILDKYRLTLAEDNRRMNGNAVGGRTRGKFSLRR